MPKYRPYSPPQGEHTAGAVRRATERAFHRHLDQQISAEQAEAVGAKIPAVEAPGALLADELTRQDVPNRAARRALARHHRHAQGKQNVKVAHSRQIWEEREAKRAEARLRGAEVLTEQRAAQQPKRGFLGRVRRAA